MNEIMLSYSIKKLDVDFDFISIIDGLNDIDRKKFDISNQINNIITTNNFKTRYCELSSSSELFDEIESLLDLAKNGKRFLIHFVCHGNKNGIQIGSDFIPWNNLLPELQKINIVTEDSLVLNMSSCKGLYGVCIVPENGIYPFFGLIGANEDLSVSNAKNINQLFYKDLIIGKPINEIIPEINTLLGKDILFNITAEGYRQLAYSN
jgi:hypothetical protein